MSDQLLSEKTNVSENQIQSLTDDVMKRIPAILLESGKAMDGEQIEKLSTHIRAMARRALNGENLPDFDKSLFDEVSDKSLSTARQVVSQFQGLPDEEALILSIHFEMAQDL